MSRNKKFSSRTRQVKNSGYNNETGGASLTNKHLKEYLPRHYSAKTDIDFNLNILRNRAADLAINSPVGAAIIQTMVTNVIGTGLKLFPRINSKALNISPDAAREWCRNTKREFEMWADNSFCCDFSRRNTFGELQNISFTSALTDGDSFALFRRRLPSPENPYSLRLMLIEAQRVSNPAGSGEYVGNISPVEMLLSNGHRVVNGIEIDQNGTLFAAWVSNRIWDEPGAIDANLKWQRVKFFGDKTGTKNLLHICRDTRPGQFRGVPCLAPVILQLKQIARYTDAELSAAIIRSFLAVFFTQAASNIDLNSILPKADEDPNKPVVDVSDYRLGSGTVSALPAGVDVKAIDAGKSQSTFDAYTTSLIKQTGAALGLPYEVLMKNFQASYSASKAALMQAADEFRRLRKAFVEDFCRPIYETFLMEAISIGRIKAPGFFDDPLIRSLWCNAEWYAEGSHLLDPIKEIQGAQLKIALGLSTYEKEAAELCGTDFNENADVLTAEKELMSQFAPAPEQPDNSEGENSGEENSDRENGDDETRQPSGRYF